MSWEVNSGQSKGTLGAEEGGRWLENKNSSQCLGLGLLHGWVGGSAGEERVVPTRVPAAGGAPSLAHGRLEVAPALPQLRGATLWVVLWGTPQLTGSGASADPRQPPAAR